MKSISKKIGNVRDRLSRLYALAETISSFEAYAGSTEKNDIAERNIHVAIESCLDIGKILISNHKLREPADNKGVFFVLAEAGFIDNDCLKFLIPMAGTRNILVHGYDRVDKALIYGILKKHLPDFEVFLKQVEGIAPSGENTISL